jgi:hypothetical protein
MLGTTAWDMSTVVSSKPHLHTMLQQWLVKVLFHILFDEYKLGNNFTGSTRGSELLNSCNTCVCSPSLLSYVEMHHVVHAWKMRGLATIW